jgi:hypothetical protein
MTYPPPSYPPGWPKCPNCGAPALDGHITCGNVECAEAAARVAISATNASVTTLCAVFGAMSMAIEQWGILAQALSVSAEKIAAARAIGRRMDDWCNTHGGV